MYTIILLCWSMLVHFTDSANILYVIPFTSTSHYMVLAPLGLELARRGHNVTVITSKREKNPPSNYHQVMVDNKKIWDILGGERPNVFTMVDLSAADFHHKILWKGGLAFTELTLNSTEVKRFLKQNNTFDLVINEQFFQEALYSLAYKYNAPLTLVTTFGNCMRHNIVDRNPLQLATVLQEFLDVKNPSSFVGRLRNFYFTAYEYIYWRLVYLEKQDQLVQKYMPEIGDDRPSLYTLQKETALMLLNSHFSFDPPTAYLPNIVEIGGLHLTRSDKSLPEDLKKIMDESIHGIIYMSFGSNVRSSELPLDKKKAFLNVFRTLKQTVIWKWEDDELEDKPNNLVIRKWLPQKEILAHSNVKVFISHGGLIGTQEAVFNGVPLIGIPIYADQYNNLLLVEQAGCGKILHYHDINEGTFEKTLSDVLNNGIYMKRAKEMSQKFRDRPMTPLDTAVFWLEYVIRNKGAEYMKNPARNLSWIAYNMLDVYAFVSGLIIICLIVITKAISVVLKYWSTHRVQVIKYKHS